MEGGILIGSALLITPKINVSTVQPGSCLPNARNHKLSKPDSHSRAQDNCDTEATYRLFNRFYVDHTEPLAMSQYKKRGQRCLGEFLNCY